MPELPDPKPRPHPWKEPGLAQSTIRNPPSTLARYADLHVTSNFTFLTGGSHPDELVQRAAELGHAAIAITDVNSLAGVVRAHIAAKEIGLPLVVGCHLQLNRHEGTEARRHEGVAETDRHEGTEARRHEGFDESVASPSLRAFVPPCLRASSQLRASILVFPTNRAAYGRLCRLLTLGKRRTTKGECHLTIHDLIDHQQDLLAVVVPPRTLDQHCLETLEGLKRHFDDDRLSIAASVTFDQDNHHDRLHQIALLAKHTGIPMVSTNDVHYHTPERRALQDVLTCIKHGCTISQAGFRLFANAERHLKPPEVMAKIFSEYPGAIARTAEIADRTKGFSLDQLKYQYPDEVVPPGSTPMQHLINLTWQGAVKHYPSGIPPKVRGQIEHEFKLIDELNYAPYFLTVHDLVVYARSKGILCQGRGAAANSAVCYCLNVTAVDPDRIDLLFERFISKERNEPPDIDIDFEHERREEVIQYIYGKYGRDRAALTAEVISYRGRSAVREVGKALGLSLDCVDRLAKSTEWWSHGVADPERLREMGLNPNDPTIHQLSTLANQILGFPRHLSQHVGGFVITQGPLCESVPIENAAMPDRTVIEWDKDDIDALGMLKVDVLGLGMLTCIGKAFGFLNSRHEGTEARRHEVSANGCTEIALETSSIRRWPDEWNNSDVSGSDCVAESHESRQGHLSNDQVHASQRAVRIDESDAARGCVDSLEHCGGICASKHPRLPEISAHGERFAGGTFNAARIGDRSGDAQGGFDQQQSLAGNRSGAAGVDSEFGKEEPGVESKGTEARRHEGTEGMEGPDLGEGSGIGGFSRERNLVLAALINPLGADNSPASCLRAFVPPCLSVNPSCLHASAPPCLSVNTPCLRASVPPCLSFPLELHTVPPEDPVVYDMICHADTIGVFQIESRAQMSMLPRLRPRSFYDLVIEVAIVRPGPIQGDMVHPYLRRRNGLEKIEYPNEAVERVLKKTLGVPLFQEQAMSLAIVAAGFTPGEADQLRRAIAAWKSRPHQIDEFGERLVNGMIERGYQREFAERCFRQIQGFSGYGFPESHAASFALLVYVSSWLKCHYPAEFAAALINSQPMGFYAPAQIVRDAKEHGVEVRPIDVNCSEWDCTMEERKARRHGGTEAQSEGKDSAAIPSCLRASVPLCLSVSPPLRLGMRLVRGLSKPDADAIAKAVKQHGPFTDIQTLWRASGVRVSVLRRLARADAFNSMGLDRQHALWIIRGLCDEALPMFEQKHETRRRGGTEENKHDVEQSLHSPRLSASAFASITLPHVPPLRKVAHDYASIGLSLRSHPIAHIRNELNTLGVTPNIELKDPRKWPQNRIIAVAGLVLVRQRPSTANGIVFMTLEDETGVANLIVRPDVYKRCRKTARHGVVVLARGKVERQGEVVHVLINHLEDVPLGSETPAVVSRDFH